MLDISMCPGGECPVKENCYRYRCFPDKDLQSFFVEPPFESDEDGCEYFMGINEDDRIRNLEDIK